MGNADSKAAFRSSIDRLTRETVPATETEFWENFLPLNLGSDELFDLLTTADIRILKVFQRRNLCTLFQKLLGEISRAVKEANGNAQGVSKQTQEILVACVRVVTRIVPTLLESTNPKTIPAPAKQPSPHTAETATSDDSTLANPSFVPLLVMTEKQAAELAYTADEFVHQMFWSPGGCFLGATQEDASPQLIPVGGSPVISQSQPAPLKPAKSIDSEDGDMSTSVGKKLRGAGGSMTDIEPNAHSVLAIQILTAVQLMLFLNGFTVVIPPGFKATPKSEPLPHHKVDERLLWKSGFGTKSRFETIGNAQLYKNRTDVLRCLLALLMGVLYQTVDQYQEEPPLWIWFYSRGFLPFTANLFCSLMGTVFLYDPNTRGPEETLVSAALQLLCVLVDFNPSLLADRATQPPVSSASQDKSVQQQSALNSNQASTDLSPAAFSNFTEANKGESATARKTTKAAQQRNVFRTMLAGIRSDSEIDLVFQGFSRCLSTLPLSRQSLFRGPRAVPFHQELLIMLWHCLTGNPVMTRHFCSKLNANELLAPILFVLLDTNNLRKSLAAAPATADGSSTFPSSNSNSNNLYANARQTDFSRQTSIDGEASPPATNSAKSTQSRQGGAVSRAQLGSSSTTNAVGEQKKQERVGLLHVCSFVLLVLSSERDFGVRLNEPCPGRFPLDIPVFQGSFADLLTIVIAKVVTDSSTTDKDDSLIDMLLTVLCNVSAYIKSFCLESCVKLISLFQRLSKPRWLFRAPYRYHDIFFLIDTFNNLIQYQYEGNLQMVYSILRQKELFTALQQLEYNEAKWLKYLGRFYKLIPSSSPAQSAAVNDAVIIHGADDESEPRKGQKTEAAVDVGGASHQQQQREPRSVSVALGRDTGVSESTTAASLDWIYAANSGTAMDDEVTYLRDAFERMGVWVPTVEWFRDWKAKIPLLTISSLVESLLPMVEAECQAKGLIDQKEVLAYLSKTTMVGLLPVPHPIIVRNYHPNAYTALWFSTFVWGLVFVKLELAGLVDWRSVRLIIVTPPRSEKMDEEVAA